MTDDREPDLRILLVEDDRADAELTRQALRRTGRPHSLEVTSSGEEALTHLASCLAGEARLPNFVLLDLNMPGTDGRAVLHEIRQDTLLRSLPVLMLTTSTNQADVDACYQAGANSFLSKPMSFGARVALLGCLCDFWCDVARLPSLRPTPTPTP